MKPYYEVSQVSKQAHHQYMSRLYSHYDRTAYYIGLMEQAREFHPVIGLAKIWHLYEPEGIGREAFEQLGKAHGYAQELKPKTTFKSPSVSYDNLLVGQHFTANNQLWVTDITYYRIKERYYYISMIMDLYIRKIVACDVADSLHARHSIKLLREALKKVELFEGHSLIHHSDKGSQYTCLEYIRLLNKNNIGISMCRSVYENTHMERLKGIIKNDYLVHWQPTTFNQLKRKLREAVRNYNNCPHGSLEMMSPN
jgi:putative transposase